MTTPARDSGVANERTSLAWQRTALSIVAGAAIMARFTWRDLGIVALLLLGAALVLAAIVLTGEHLRYRTHHAADSPGIIGHGLAGAALTAALTLMALIELIALAVGH